MREHLEMSITAKAYKVPGRCEMCHSNYLRTHQFFHWEGMLTKDKLIVCSKCAKKEAGKKYWNKVR